MLPKISGIFRLAKPVDSRFTPDGMQICSLYLVASEKYKDKESTLWIGATAFGKTAEFISSVQKGQRVYCNGKIKTDEWTDQQGQKQSRITMIIDSFEYIEKREDTGTQNNAPQNQQPNNASQQQGQQQQQAPASQPFEDEFDDDIPF